MGQCSSHRPIPKLFTANRAHFSFPYPLFLRPKSKAVVFISVFQEARFCPYPTLPLSESPCYCACRRSCYNFVSQKSPLHTSTRRSPSISSNLLRYRTAVLSTSIQATLAGRFGTSEYGLSKRAGELFYSPFPYVVFFNSVQFSWINPSEHTRIGQRVSMLSASGRLRVFSLCGGSPLV